VGFVALDAIGVCVVSTFSAVEPRHVVTIARNPATSSLRADAVADLLTSVRRLRPHAQLDNAPYSDAYVTSDATGSRPVWASHLGGSYNDYGIAVAVAPDGRVTRRAQHGPFPTRPRFHSDRSFAGGGAGDAIVGPSLSAELVW
jgi:hypothetical protein